MGHTLWVDVRGMSQDDQRDDNSLMVRLQDPLDDLCAKLNVAKLSDFHDYSQLEAEYADFDEDLDEHAEIEMSDIQAAGNWLNPNPALASVQALRTHLECQPNDLVVESPAWRKQVLDELKYCQVALEKAVADGTDFRFLIVA